MRGRRPSQGPATDAAVLAAAAGAGPDGMTLHELAAAVGRPYSTAQSAVARMRAAGEWPHAWPYSWTARPAADGEGPRRHPSSAVGAMTDARMLDAGRVLAGRAEACTADLARLAGVHAVTAAASVRRLRARGEWPWDFPADGRGRGRGGPGRRRAEGGRRAPRMARGDMVRVPSAKSPSPAVVSAYINGVTARREPVDLAKARAACDMLREAAGKGVRSLGRAAYSGSHT